MTVNYDHERIAYDFKTTSHILMQFYTVMYLTWKWNRPKSEHV